MSQKERRKEKRDESKQFQRQEAPVKRPNQKIGEDLRTLLKQDRAHTPKKRT